MSTGARPTTAALTVAALTAVFAAGRARAANPVTFDFESTPTTAYASRSLTSLALTNGGLTLTLARQDGSGFDVINNTQFGAPFTFPPAFGTHTLSPLGTANNDPSAAFVANLSAPATAASIQFGDFGQDDDVVTLTGYAGPNATGAVVATSTVDYPASSDLSAGTIGMASVGGTAFLSFTFNDVGDGGNSYNTVFYDNLAVTSSVPEPATAGLIGLGGAALLARRRARNRAAIA